MAIAARNSSNMSHDESSSNNNNNNNKSDDNDNHEHDVVMPGFRFHPTEEELVEFYLRRKVEGKRFNVELITFLDLYRYDPWELPAMAAIGEKEWFFYVPRDRKYRNGDRPNRVTTSGYWKATGADRMIRTEDFRSIGLKKTLVFYSGKAPKGIRTSWIMNEYRLPQHETERYQKAEISLCRVYKRAGVEDHPSLPRSLPSRASSSSRLNTSLGKKHLQVPDTINIQTSSSSTEKFQTSFDQSHFQQHNHHLLLQVDKISVVETADVSASSSCEEVTTVLGLSKHNPFPIITSLGLPSSAHNSMEEDDQSVLHKQHPLSSLVLPNYTSFFNPSSSSLASHSLDDLQNLIHYQQPPPPIPPASTDIMNNPPPLQFYQDGSGQIGHFSLTPRAPQQQLALNTLPSSLPIAFSDRLWEWNPIPDANRDQYANPFK